MSAEKICKVRDELAKIYGSNAAAFIIGINIGYITPMCDMEDKSAYEIATDKNLLIFQSDLDAIKRGFE